MGIEIRSLHAPDLWDLLTYVPVFWEAESFLLEMDIGEAGDDACDVYSVMVCGPAVANTLPPDEKRLVLPVFSGAALQEALDAIVVRCEAAHRPWEALLERFHWEYEGYS